MTAATEPRSELVILEPRNRATLDSERSQLIQDVESQLPAEIVSPSEYEAIADLESSLDRFIDRAEPLFDDHCKTAHRVWKQATDIRAAFLDAPKRLKARCRLLLGAYKDREDRIRRDEERRIAEEQRQAEIVRLKAEAKLAEQSGQKELAAAIRATPVDAPSVVLPSAVPDVHGLSYREDWYWEPVGGDSPANRQRALSLMVRPEYVMFVALNDGGLTAFAKRTKGTIKVPGILFRSRQVPVRR